MFEVKYYFGSYENATRCGDNLVKCEYRVFMSVETFRDGQVKVYVVRGVKG